jgi:hypothetical protein
MASGFTFTAEATISGVSTTSIGFVYKSLWKSHIISSINFPRFGGVFHYRDSGVGRSYCRHDVVLGVFCIKKTRTERTAQSIIVYSACCVII